MRPGEVRRAHFECSDGREAPPPRRVLILAVGPVGAGEDQVVVVAYITSKDSLVNNPLLGDIPLDESDACGLDAPSVVRCRQFASIPRARIGDRLGQVEVAVLIQAQDAARDILGRD